MKSLLFLGLLTVSMFAHSNDPVMGRNGLNVGVSVNCQAVKFYPKGLLAVDVSFEGRGPLATLKSKLAPLAVDHEGKITTIKGLKVRILKAKLIHRFKQTGVGIIGYTSHVRVYGVRMKAKANEDIGIKFVGDVMRPVREMDIYTVCYEVSTKN